MTLQGRQIAVTSCPFLWFIKGRIHFIYGFFFAPSSSDRTADASLKKILQEIILIQNIYMFLREEEIGKRFSVKSFSLCFPGITKKAHKLLMRASTKYPRKKAKQNKQTIKPHLQQIKQKSWGGGEGGTFWSVWWSKLYNLFLRTCMKCSYQSVEKDNPSQYFVFCWLFLRFNHIDSFSIFAK